MQVYIDAVQAFHEKMGVSGQQRLRKKKLDSLDSVGELLITHAGSFNNRLGDKDRRFLRAHLLLEELGETLQAMAHGDELKMLDGLCDLLYVLFGTAVTFDLPLQAGFSEVHASNMTKERQPDDPEGDRVRDKGPNWRAPDLECVLTSWRACETKRKICNRRSVETLLCHMQPGFLGDLSREQQMLVRKICGIINWSRPIDAFGTEELRKLLASLEGMQEAEETTCQEEEP